MANFDFVLKSGAKLHISTAPFEAAVAVYESVKKATIGLDENVDVDVALSNPEVRKALYGVMPWSLYDTIKVSPALFDDPKDGERARSDYLEICSRLIEANVKAFFLNRPSASLTPPETTTPNPGQP